VAHRKDVVDLALGVAHARLERLGQPVQHDEALAARRRHGRDAAVPDERGQHLAPLRRLGVVLAARRSRPRRAGRLLERVPVELEPGAVGPGDDQPAVDEATEGTVGPIGGQPRTGRDLVGGRRPEDQRGGHAAAVVVGEQADDHPGVELRPG
jgi:hypothetical protein